MAGVQNLMSPGPHSAHLSLTLEPQAQVINYPEPVSSCIKWNDDS